MRARPRHAVVLGLVVLLVIAIVAQTIADRPKETFAAVIVVVPALVGLVVLGARWRGG